MNGETERKHSKKDGEKSSKHDKVERAASKDRLARVCLLDLEHLVLVLSVDRKIPKLIL